MFVKVIRNNATPTGTEVYEPKFFEFRKLEEGKEYQQGASEEILMTFDEQLISLVLYEKDEVWLTSNTGQTVDRWKI